MNRKWRWNERTRLMLTLELAVVLPAAALVVLGALHLKSIQRDRGVQAAFQRDFSQVLAISEKQINRKAYDLVDEVKDQFPSAGAACKETMDRILSSHPYVAHVFLYDPATGMVFRSQPNRQGDAVFRAEGEYFSGMFKGWMQVEFWNLNKDLGEMQKKERRYFFQDSVARGDKHAYTAGELFLVNGSAGPNSAVAGVVFDAEYLRDQLF